ncbi:MAG: pilus assembly protein TadG-related protein, partial [Planctomycetota bacterium]
MLAAFFMLAMMAMLAFCVDLGYITAMKSELQRACDSAALAGAGTLVEGPEEAQLEAFEFLVRNPVGQRLLAEGADWEQNLGDTMSQNQDVSIDPGYWDPEGADNSNTPDDERFAVYDDSAGPPSAIRVHAIHRNVPLFFGNMFRRTERVYDENGFHDEPVPIDLAAESIARYRPRDIMLVLDFSGSMNDDSELKRIAEAASADKATVKAKIEANLQLIDEQLRNLVDPPAFGDLPFTPAWPTVHGQPAAGDIPHCTVTFGTDQYGTKSVDVTSTMQLDQVIVKTDNGAEQTFSSLSGTSGRFKASNNRRIVSVWVKSGGNDTGDGRGELIPLNNTTIKKAFGLDQVAYPYPS